MESFWSHRKVAELGRDRADAVCLWTLAHSWVDYQQTDGLVPADTPSLLTGWKRARVRKAADALVRVRLWEQTEGGWTFHDWAEHNLTREDRAAFRRGGERGGATRARTAERGERGRFASSADADAPVADVAGDQTESGGESGKESGDKPGGESGVGKGVGKGSRGSETRESPSAHEAGANGTSPSSLNLASPVELVGFIQRQWGWKVTAAQLPILSDAMQYDTPEEVGSWVAELDPSKDRDPIKVVKDRSHERRNARQVQADARAEHDRLNHVTRTEATQIIDTIRTQIGDGQ